MKFLCTTDHYLAGDQYVEAGTVIGDDTPYPLTEDFVPSAAMTPVDDDAKAAFEERHGEGRIVNPAAAEAARTVRPRSVDGMQLHPAYRDGFEDRARDRPNEDPAGRVSPVYASQLAMETIEDVRREPGLELPEVDPNAEVAGGMGGNNQLRGSDRPNKTEPPVDLEGFNMSEANAEADEAPAKSKRGGLLSSKK